MLNKFKILSVIPLFLFLLGCSSDDNGNQVDIPQVIGEEGDITLYNIVNGNAEIKENYIVTGQELEYQKATNKHLEMWNLVKRVVPDSHMKRFNEYIVINGGATGNLGYVVQTNQDLSTWKIGLSISDAYTSDDVFNGDGDFAYTVIHEFGHVISLNETQIDPTISESDCQQFHTTFEGCSFETSYINTFFKEFWSDIWDEYNAVKDNQTELSAFYLKYKDRFHTAYSVTNPIEDWAETFATFVIRDGGANNDGTIKEDKIKMMQNTAELVEIRDFIRNNNVLTTSSSLRNLTSNNLLLLPKEGEWSKSKTIGNPNKRH